MKTNINQSPGPDEQSLKGKPRRNIHRILAVLISTVLVTAIFYGAYKHQHEVKVEKSKSGQLTNNQVQTPTQSEIERLIKTDVANAEKDKKKIKPVKPKQGPNGIPPELKKIIEKGRIENNERITGNDSQNPSASKISAAVAQRQEAAAASSILIQYQPQNDYADSTNPGAASNTPPQPIVPASPASDQNITPKDLAQALNSGRPQGPETVNDHNNQWLTSQSGSSQTGVIKIVKNRSQYVINQGTIIPAVLVTRLDSDLPGMVVARVTTDVYDTINEHYLLIPKGSRLIGQYDSNISTGQERLLIAFNRIILPNGNSAWLNGMQGASDTGESGFSDQVNNHFWKIFGSSFLIAGLTQWAQGNNATTLNMYGVPPGAMMGNAAGQAMLSTSNAILAKNQNIQPTLIIRQGYRFNVMVAKDMQMMPYQGTGN